MFKTHYSCTLTMKILARQNANGIIAIPPFMTLALMRANSSDLKVLCLAAVEAIKHILENESEEEQDAQQNMLIDLIDIPHWLFLVSRRSTSLLVAGES